MTSKNARRKPRRLDADELTASLWSADAQARLKALKQMCPCRSGFTLYERLRQDVRRLQKDPVPAVRRAALHIVEEACRIERKETELDRADDLGVRPGDADWTAAQRRRRATRTWEPL